MPGEVPFPTDIIHVTHVDNLPGIFCRGELRSIAMLQHSPQRFTSIAYTSIQLQRAEKIVPCGPGGCLHDYVPFYFGKRSPMLFTISRGNVACEGGQDALVHLVSTAQAVADEGLGFAFSDGHGIMSYTAFYDDLDDLGEIDWNVIASQYWNDTQDDGDRKRRRQAEFLVRDRFPLGLIAGIVVRTESMRERVEALLQKSAHQPRLSAKASWYY